MVVLVPIPATVHLWAASTSHGWPLAAQDPVGEQRAGLQFVEHRLGVPGSGALEKPSEGLREQQKSGAGCRTPAD